MTREYTRRTFASLLGGLGTGVATVGLSGRGAAQADGGARYVTAISQEPSSIGFNPYASDGTTVAKASDAVFERFARFDLADASFVLVGLEDWTVDGDAVALTVREGLQWHDGEAVTAADLEAKLLLDEMAGVGLGPSVESVSTDDDRTVTVTLTEPLNSRFVKHRLAERRIDTPRSVYERFLDGSVEDLRGLAVGRHDVVGCGPFESVPDQRDTGALLLRRFADHPDAADVAVEHYDFVYEGILGDRLAAVDHGVVDGGVTAFATPSTVESLDDVVEARLPEKWGYGLVPNHDHEHVGRRAVRRAIMHVIDRQAVAAAAGPRTKRPVPVPTAIPVDDQERWLGDAMDDYERYGVDESRTERAAQLLREAGYAEEGGVWVDETGSSVELPVTTPEGWRDWVAATEAVAEQLRAFGFEVTVEERPVADLLDTVWPEGEFVLTAGTWLPGGDDAAFPGRPFEHQFGESTFGYRHGYPGAKESVGGDDGTVTLPDRTGDGETTVRPSTLSGRLVLATEPSEVEEIVRLGAWVANRDLPMLPLLEKEQQVFFDAGRLALPPAGDGAYQFSSPGTRLVRTGRVEPTVPAPLLPLVDGTLPTDPDDDGIYEDLNANGEVDYADVVTLFENLDDSSVQARSDPLDFNGNGEVDYADLVALFQEV